MQKLDYHTPPTHLPVTAAQCFLILLPLIPTGFTFFSALIWVGEPFGSVQPREVVLFGGAPVVVLGSAIAWYIIARKRRVAWVIIVIALGWFALLFYGSIDSLWNYFQEPWNR